MITAILIILFFVVLALTPTYFVIEYREENGNYGTIVGCAPLIITCYNKIRFFKDTIIISRRMYEKIWETYRNKGEN